jgi:hypothetical protein
MLVVETPYGIYQCIDWVAQAQLCTAVGPERFLMLRQINIRTIFDLERAALHEKESTPQGRALIGSVLFAETSKRKKMMSDLGIVYAGSATDKGPVTITVPDDATLKQFIRVMMDDLHIYRLRQIWNHISDKLGPDARTLKHI